MGQLSFTLRRAEVSDAEAVARVVRASVLAEYPKCYGPGTVEFFLSLHALERVLASLKQEEVWAAEKEGKIIGTGARRGGEILRLYVAPECFQMGVGSAILERLTESAVKERITRLTADVSRPAEAFYLRRGFAAVEERSERLHCGELLRWRVMQRGLGKPCAEEDPKRSRACD